MTLFRRKMMTIMKRSVRKLFNIENLLPTTHTYTILHSSHDFDYRFSYSFAIFCFPLQYGV